MDIIEESKITVEMSQEEAKFIYNLLGHHLIGGGSQMEICSEIHGCLAEYFDVIGYEPPGLNLNRTRSETDKLFLTD